MDSQEARFEIRDEEGSIRDTGGGSTARWIGAAGVALMRAFS
jgi:hypothetical protein